MKKVLFVFVLLFGSVFAQKVCNSEDVLTFPEDYVGKLVKFNGVGLVLGYMQDKGRYEVTVCKNIDTDMHSFKADTYVSKKLLKELMNRGFSKDLKTRCDVTGRVVQEKNYYYFMIDKVN